MKKIPLYKIKIEPLEEAAKSMMGFEYADKETGKRSKIGGDPDLLQEEPDAICSGCGGIMNFYAQLDSIGDKLIFADCGMVYIYVCFDCYETKSFIQC